MISTVDLLAAISTHLAEFELPAIASVHAAPCPSGPQVSVQLPSSGPSTLAQGLLIWADTLTEITAEAWRVPRDASVHLSVTGLLPGGAAVRVYGAMRATDRGPGAGLEPNTTETLPLRILRHLATPGQITEEVSL